MIIFTVMKCQAMMRNNKLQSKIQKKFPISQFKESIEEYYKNMSGGKFLLCPMMEDAVLSSDPQDDVLKEFDLY